MLTMGLHFQKRKGQAKQIEKQELAIHTSTPKT
jgi:hypothetical protein